jgi:hypothetical protein
MAQKTTRQRANPRRPSGRIFMRRTLLAGASAAILLTGMSFAHANPTGPKGPGFKDCGSSFSVVWSPTQVFPPNHKMVDGTLAYNAPAGDAIDQLKLQITGIVNNEVVDGEEMNGSGNTLIDSNWDTDAVTGTGSVSRAFQIRAERSGLGVGRTYTVTYTATADPAVATGLGTSNNCSGSVDVFIPHDMGGGNDS